MRGIRGAKEKMKNPCIHWGAMDTRVLWFKIATMERKNVEKKQGKGKKVVDIEGKIWYSN